MYCCIILKESGEYNPCLNVARSLPMALFSNTHTFAPEFDEEDPQPNLES
jgi:hypothetical protein